LIVQSAEGTTIRDVNGREYLDWHSGSIHMPLGHGNKYVLEAMHKVIDELQCVSLLHTHPYQAILAEKLSQILPNTCQRPYLCSSGSEAVESSFKMSRQYYRNIGAVGKYMFIARWLSYHGSTLGALSATGTMTRWKFGPLVPGFSHVFPPYCYRCAFGQEYPGCDFECVRAIKETIEFEGHQNIAGVIGEPILGGGGGIVPPPKEYWPMVREICTERDCHLIIDEVMTGFGRTGKMFAIEHWGVKPDIIVLGKGMSAGYLPISATCATPEISESFYAEPAEGKEFMHGQTYGANSPILCATASAAIDVIRKEKLAERAAELGRYLMVRLEQIKDLPIVGDVRGVGLFCAIELVMDKSTKRVFPPEKMYGRMIEQMCRDRGLSVWCRWGMSDCLVCAPPLIITRDEIDRAMKIIADVLKEVGHKIGVADNQRI
jgi:adenosylmethionine-8-amino-7-oxononanoate aminotransferase